MSRARHHHHMKKAHGGRTDHPTPAGGEPQVLKEADEKKKGGRVKHLGHLHGAKPHHRLDRRGRKRGGRVGADMAPLSSAHKVSGGDGM